MQYEKFQDFFLRNILADNWLHIQKFKATELTSPDIICT